MKATKHTYPESANNFDTSEILLIFSFLSSAENPKSLLSPYLMISPSKINTLFLSPSSLSSFSLIAVERVDFPAPDSPVNQKVAPFSIVYC